MLFASGCTGTVATLTAKDTRWSKAGATYNDLEKEYRQCRGLVSQAYSADISLLKGAAVHANVLDCLRDQKGWTLDEHGTFVVPARGFK